MRGNWSRRTVLIDGNRIDFTLAEWFLFRELLAERGTPIDSLSLHNRMYNHRRDGGPSLNTMAKHMDAVRKKLEPTRFRIPKIRGTGCFQGGRWIKLERLEYAQA